MVDAPGVGSGEWLVELRDGEAPRGGAGATVAIVLDMWGLSLGT